VELYRVAKQAGLVTTLDPQFPLYDFRPPWMPAVADLLPHVDVLFCDDHEARSLTAVTDLSDAAHILLSAGPRTVVIKQGSEGSTVYRNGFAYQQAAIMLGDVVDTIGAGDAYDAGFILGTLEGWPLERCALFAAIAAGFTVTGVGGSQTMPTREVIETEMAARSQ
jgi:2-dehydro-3-deoxygluconokinase